eukprot:COSAG03_NODE_11656_length_582_cov_0.633540_1_plen_69_part_01
MATSDTDFFSGINAVAEEDEEEYKKTWKLPQRNELRFEVRTASVAHSLAAARLLICHARRRWRRRTLCP